MKVAMYAAFVAFTFLIGEKTYGAEAVCSSSAVIFCDDFESGNLNQWQDGYNANKHTITTDLANVYQGGRALQVLYPQGADGGWLTRWFMPGYDNLYVRLFAKWQLNWQGVDKIVAFYGNRIDNQWSGFGRAGTKPNGTDFFYTALLANQIIPPDPGEVIFYSYFPEMLRAPDGMYWGNYFYQNNPRIGIQPGQWYCLELELKVNTPGLHDGYQRMWINGQFKGEANNIRWRDTTDLRINAVQLTFSGGGPKAEYEWIDNLVLSTQQIGCGGNSGVTPPTPPTGLIVR